MTTKFITFLLLLFFFSCIALPVHAENSFIDICDIHFDPFLGSKDPTVLTTKLLNSPHNEWDKIFEDYCSKTVSQPKQDSNSILLNLLIAFLKKGLLEKPDFIIINGDFLGHSLKSDFEKYSGSSAIGLYELFVNKIYQYIIKKFKDTFPDVSIYCSIGNNDSYNGDYFVTPNGSFYTFLSSPLYLDNWHSCFQNERNKKRFKEYFFEGGYYEVEVPGNKKNRIIVLNTILLSKNVKGPSASGQDVDKAAKKQFKWLRKKLEHAHRHKNNVLILSHIPYGIDAFTTIYSNKTTLFLQDQYNTEFIKVLNKYSNVISGVISAHIHSDAFNFTEIQEGDKTEKSVFSSISPSISPLFGNNPGFKVFTYNSHNMQLINFKVYYLDIWNIKAPTGNDWAVEYDFSQLYSSPLKAGFLNFPQKGEDVQKYRKYYDTGATCEYININKQSYWDVYWKAISNPNGKPPASIPIHTILTTSSTRGKKAVTPLTVSNISSFINIKAASLSGKKLIKLKSSVNEGKL